VFSWARDRGYGHALSPTRRSWARVGQPPSSGTWVLADKIRLLFIVGKIRVLILRARGIRHLAVGRLGVRAYTRSVRNMRIQGRLPVHGLVWICGSGLLFLGLATTSLYACATAPRTDGARACEADHHTKFLVVCQFLVQFTCAWIVPLFVARRFNEGSGGPGLGHLRTLVFVYALGSVAYGLHGYAELVAGRESRSRQLDGRCRTPGSGKRNFFKTAPDVNCPSTLAPERRISCYDVYTSTRACGPAAEHEQLGAWVPADQGSVCPPATLTVLGARIVWIGFQASLLGVYLVWSVGAHAYSRYRRCRRPRGHGPQDTDVIEMQLVRRGPGGTWSDDG
jgi:hypothetical protein